MDKFSFDFRFYYSESCLQAFSRFSLACSPKKDSSTSMDIVDILRIPSPWRLLTPKAVSSNLEMDWIAVEASQPSSKTAKHSCKKLQWALERPELQLSSLYWVLYWIKFFLENFYRLWCWQSCCLLSLCHLSFSFSICLSSTSMSFVACWGFNASLFMVFVSSYVLWIQINFASSYSLSLYLAFLRRSFEALETSLSTSRCALFTALFALTVDRIPSLGEFHINVPFFAIAFEEFPRHNQNRFTVIRKFTLRKVQRR